MAETPVDFVKFFGKYEFKPRESSEDAEHRRSEEVKESDHRRKKDLFLFVIVSSMVILVGVACLWIMLNPGYSIDLQKSAASLLTVIVSASVGFMTGKNSK